MPKRNSDHLDDSKAFFDSMRGRQSHDLFLSKTKVIVVHTADRHHRIGLVDFQALCDIRDRMFGLPRGERVMLASYICDEAAERMNLDHTKDRVDMLIALVHESQAPCVCMYTRSCGSESTCRTPSMDREGLLTLEMSSHGGMAYKGYVELPDMYRNAACQLFPNWISPAQQGDDMALGHTAYTD